MSSAVVSTSAALGRHFLFEDESAPQVGSRPPLAHKRHPLKTANHALSPELAQVTPASRLTVRPAPEMASSGIAAIDALTGGLPRGCLTEICGPASSGRTSVLLAALAAATLRGEFCVLVDASDALDPASLAVSGIHLEKLLWVRCTEHSPQRQRGTEKKRQIQQSRQRVNPAELCLEQVLRTTDLLLESGGFGLIVLDLADLPFQVCRRIPLTTWFRFRRAVEHKPAILLVLDRQPVTGSCASVVLKTSVDGSQKLSHKSFWEGHGFSRAACDQKKHGLQPLRDAQFAEPSHAQLLTGLDVRVELLRSRLGSAPISGIGAEMFSQRKPAASVSAAFTSKTAWG